MVKTSHEKKSVSVCHLLFQGYEFISNRHNLSHLYKIRGDNYCALRAAHCSMLVNKIVSERLQPDQLANQLQVMRYIGIAQWLERWTQN